MLYDYRCPVCGHTEELIVKHNARNSTYGPCRKCFQADLERVLKPQKTSFVLKGTGWFADGYAK